MYVYIYIHTFLYIRTTVGIHSPAPLKHQQANPKLDNRAPVEDCSLSYHDGEMISSPYCGTETKPKAPETKG